MRSSPTSQSCPIPEAPSGLYRPLQDWVGVLDDARHVCFFFKGLWPTSYLPVSGSAQCRSCGYGSSSHSPWQELEPPPGSISCIFSFSRVSIVVWDGDRRRFCLSCWPLQDAVQKSYQNLRHCYKYLSHIGLLCLLPALVITVTNYCNLFIWVVL